MVGRDGRDRGVGEVGIPLVIPSNCATVRAPTAGYSAASSASRICTVSVSASFPAATCCSTAVANTVLVIEPIHE